ncbi:unnamed protein product, partial [marine sediment metagenome]
MNALIECGVTVHQAVSPFTVVGKSYPVGSYVVKAAQAFRPHVRSMFEPQDYPDDIPYPGADPIPPYDSAGWTLAYDMGIEFDRVYEGFDGPFEELADVVDPPKGKIPQFNAEGYLLSPETNDAIVAVNRLIGTGHEIYRLKEPSELGGKVWPPGTYYIEAQSSTGYLLMKMAEDIGLDFVSVDTSPEGDALLLKPVRIGL